MRKFYVFTIFLILYFFSAGNFAKTATVKEANDKAKSSLLKNDATKADSSKSITETNFYTEDKPNIQISMTDSEFTLRLKSNPTTGFTWFLREYNPVYIMPLKRSFERSKEALVGATGYEYWTFRATPAAFQVPIQTLIRMVYARPWQSNEGSTQVIFFVTSNTN